MAKELLIIFTKNPEKGKVKTRLAADLGEEKALAVYKRLLWHTHQIVKDLGIDKCVAYSDYINLQDIWENDKFQKSLQGGDDLGMKMQNAFAEGFKKSYDHICLIGSDILELTPSIVGQAFRHLHDHDLVLGPASDGGYYLIGMKRLQPELFAEMPWSTKDVLSQTLEEAHKQHLRIALLPTLSDIDTVEDIKDDDKGFLLS